MIGIKRYGGYIPYHRIKRSEIAKAYGKKAKENEKAVAYYDEDSLTMAVAASLNAVTQDEGAGLDALYFATTSAPYREKQSATQLAAVLDCARAVRTADFEGSLKACSDAMLVALEYAKSGQNSLVATADCRLGGADGNYENTLGDGGAAFVIGGGEEVLAQYLGSHSVSFEALDIWRSTDDSIVRFWDVRYSFSEIYKPLVGEAVKGLLEKTGLTPADFSKVACYAHEEKHSLALLAKLGFAPGQIQPCLYDDIGNTGCAAAPLTLVSLLEDAKPKDKILFVSYGDGCNALAFEATEQILQQRPKRSLNAMLRHKNNELSYGKYLKWKDFLLCEPQRRPPQDRSSQPDYLRGYKKNHAMIGSRCTACGVPHYPPQRVCAACHAADQMEPCHFLGKKAWIRTFTADGQSLSLDPPNNLVVVEFAGGGKLMTFLDDCRREEIRVRMPVELSFRRMFQADGVNTYFWKVVPSEEGEEA